jgi:uncharacterized protein
MQGRVHPDQSDDSMLGLENVVARVGRLLPAQGPISVFIHHNTLHAFEDQVFEEAVESAANKFGCEPFLAEDRYREELARGRIAGHDMDAVLDAALGSRGEQVILEGVNRKGLWRRILVHGLRDARGVALDWILTETSVLAAVREDLPGEVQMALLSGTSGLRDPEEEAARVSELWKACGDAVARSKYTASADAKAMLRHRDVVVAALNIDTDEWVHPLLIRVTSAYLDQGLAQWSMPDRERGLYANFVDIYGSRLARFCRPFGRELHRLLAEEKRSVPDSVTSLENSLAVLGVASDEWEAFLTEEALALRGWAGMMWQFEARPDRVPVFALPARLVDFLAVRLLLTRAALGHALRRFDVPQDLANLRFVLKGRLPEGRLARPVERAWPVFQVAQLFGLDATFVGALSETEISMLEQEIQQFDSTARRRLFHQAYERRFRHQLFDALVQHQPSATPESPKFQAVFCIDEREESIRRHLEEVDPGVETFGAAGFFGVAMYYRGATDAHPRPLCPGAIQPEHYIAERSDRPAVFSDRVRGASKRLGALVDKNIHVGSRQVGRGAVIMATLGVLWIVPLVFRVLFPWSRWGASRLYTKLEGDSHPRLQIERRSEAPPIGQHTGFTVEEMATIVRGLLAPMGISGRFAPLVLVIGHGSSSLNNPQNSAYDCGACGGGRGGPNARAFAQMANDPRVRERLVVLGMRIPKDTWFVGGQRNTANNDIDLFDEDLVPVALRPALEHATESLEVARRREAHERCRRFESAPLWLPSRGALFHVQARATDLAQPRPEYGHATNAACIIGRRARTKSLFLDRRAFLVSYDFAHDPEGVALAGMLAALVPVVAGINLEYFFGCVDPTGYGCGTKLAHNVASLIGVMDGPQSDLRTGLPLQTLEIHEPMRLAIVVEVPVSILKKVLLQIQDVRRLVDNRWVFLAALDPQTATLCEVEAEGDRPYPLEGPVKSVRGPSRSYYRGRRGHLPFATLTSTDAKDAA